jgi:hypothetical protein
LDLFDLIIIALENNQQIALAMILKLKASQEEHFWEYLSDEIKNKYSQAEIFSSIISISETSKEEVTLSIISELTFEEESQFKEYAINEIKSKFQNAEDIKHHINEFEIRFRQIKQSGRVQKEQEFIASSSCRQRKSVMLRNDLPEVPQPILAQYKKKNQKTIEYEDDDEVRCCCFRF